MVAPLLNYLKGIRPTLCPNRQDSQKGLQAAVRVRHPRGCLLQGHSGGYWIKVTYSQRSRSSLMRSVSMIVSMAVCFIESQ